MWSTTTILVYEQSKPGLMFLKDASKDPSLGWESKSLSSQWFCRLSDFYAKIVNLSRNCLKDFLGSNLKIVVNTVDISLTVGIASGACA